jgi:hypothetical protein
VVVCCLLYDESRYKSSFSFDLEESTEFGRFTKYSHHLVITISKIQDFSQSATTNQRYTSRCPRLQAQARHRAIPHVKAAYSEASRRKIDDIANVSGIELQRQQMALVSST